jgi:hypothetical protein
LVKIAKTPKQSKTTETTNDIVPDYSSLQYLSQLKLIDLKPILTELSKNRNDTKKYVNKKEIIEQIIELSTTTKLPLDDNIVDSSSAIEDDVVASSEEDETTTLLQIETKSPKSKTPKKVKSRA